MTRLCLAQYDTPDHRLPETVYCRCDGAAEQQGIQRPMHLPCRPQVRGGRELVVLLPAATRPARPGGSGRTREAFFTVLVAPRDWNVPVLTWQDGFVSAEEGGGGIMSFSAQNCGAAGMGWAGGVSHESKLAGESLSDKSSRRKSESWGYGAVQDVFSSWTGGESMAQPNGGSARSSSIRNVHARAAAPGV